MNTRSILPTFAVFSTIALLTGGVLAKPSSKEQPPTVWPQPVTLSHLQLTKPKSMVAVSTSHVLAARGVMYGEPSRGQSASEQKRNNKAPDDEPDRIYDIGSGNFIDNPDKHPGEFEH